VKSGDKPSTVKRSGIGRPRSSAPVLPIYDSMKACSAATGIPLSVLENAKARGCPAFRSNRVDLALLLPLLFEKGDPTQNAKWADMREEYQAKREKIRHDKEAKLTADKNDVIFGLGKIEAEFFNQLERAQQELPATLKGCDEPTVFKKFGERIVEIKSELTLKFQQLAEGIQV
jgi:hypothetical protein